MAEYAFHYDPPKLRIAETEIAVQKVMLRTIAVMFPHSRAAAVPNGQKRTRWQQQRAKAEGMSSGFPDLIVTGPSNWGLGIMHPLVAFIEVKASAPMSPEQRDWLDFLHNAGHCCGVFRSDQTLADKLREWGFR